MRVQTLWFVYTSMLRVSLYYIISTVEQKLTKNMMLARMEITEQDGKPVEHEVIFCKADGSLWTMRAINHVKHRQGNLNFEWKNEYGDTLPSGRKNENQD